ncbi:nudix hydrolase 17, mitochondrial-like [Rhododendron vialii]|uniref:nudix hydrolase 17, mitochondrial-like n=1 Tax=Rhododendron vialii TaxID=182163 RepID=UPI00265F8B9B|nr:nudix hydrolase 17, mitochondrial-like [Rhododendron vialii]
MIRLVSRTGRHLQRYSKGLRLVVGCIPYRCKDNELEVLMISSQNGQAMLFPKGGWELDESIKEAALRETLEEAGVVGNIDEDELGKWSFKSKSRGIYNEGRMFALLVTEQLELWPEKNFRQRLWMKVGDAREVCQNWWMKEALDILVDRLTSQPAPLPTEECT